MNNVLRKRNNYYWHYIDLEEYADSIRKEERERIKKKNMRKEEIKKRKKTTLYYWILQRTLGVLLIVASVLIALSGFFYDPITDINDCTGLIVFVFIGFGLIFSNEIVFPRYIEKKEQWRIEDLERRKS